MNHCVNQVKISGNVGAPISYGTTGSGAPAVSFMLASDRNKSDGAGAITVWARVNAYGPVLVSQCRAHLEKGSFVLVDGELMNRAGQHDELTEVRARRLEFTAKES
jgi:single-stranded DNA-binding protein